MHKNNRPWIPKFKKHFLIGPENLLLPCDLFLFQSSYNQDYLAFTIESESWDACTENISDN